MTGPRSPSELPGEKKGFGPVSLHVLVQLDGLVNWTFFSQPVTQGGFKAQNELKIFVSQFCLHSEQLPVIKMILQEGCKAHLPVSDLGGRGRGAWNSDRGFTCTE